MNPPVFFIIFFFLRWNPMRGGVGLRTSQHMIYVRAARPRKRGSQTQLLGLAWRLFNI